MNKELKRFLSVIRQAQLSGALLMYSGISLLYAVTWMLQTVSLQKFFDTAQGVWNGTQKKETLVLMLAFMGTAYLFYHIMDGISNCCSEVLALKISRQLQNPLFARVKDMKALEFEDTGRLDFLEKAKHGSLFSAGVLFTILDILTYYIPYLLFMGWYLFMQDAVLAVCVLVAFLPAAVSRFSTSFLFRELEEKAAPLRRQTDYYEKCLSGRDYLRETRIWGAEVFFGKKYQEALEKKNRFWMQAVIRQNIFQIFIRFITACGYGVIIWLLFGSVMKGKISLGVFAAVLATTGNLFRFMDKMVSERLGWVTENMGTVGNFLDFIFEVEDRGMSEKRPPGRDILLKHVSFRYPHATEQALSDISFRIKDGETIALVGENGSGKTTLARVIMGLYEPTEGTVEYAGKPMTAYSSDHTSAVFQNFNRYQMTLRDNLSIGNQLDADDGKLIKIGREVELPMENGRMKLDQMLGREFGGTDLSGGQWQRVAIGRGRYREHDLIILDEPTAAIDPLEEAEIYRKFAESCKGKTAILITHRLGAVKLADRIIVLRKGKIEEEGTWNHLMESGGWFGKMYEMQRVWYRENQ